MQQPKTQRVTLTFECSMETYEELRRKLLLPEIDDKPKPDADPPFKANKPELAGYEDRLKTFADWPASIPVTGNELAIAGFFYKGKGDIVECHYCGIVFKHWLPGDEPWKAHSQWYDACGYLRWNKDANYIRNAKLSIIKINYWDREKECCKICFGNQKELVYVPCGHIVACVECGSSFENCPSCRTPVEKIVKIFYS